MGWTHTHKPKGMSDEDYLATQSGCLTWTGLPEDAHPQIVASAVGHKAIAFAVRFPAKFYETIQRPAPGYYVPAADGSITTAIVFALSNGEGRRKQYNFGYKDFAETSGCEHYVSAAILPHLSPFNLENDSGSVKSGRQWREGCAAFTASRKEAAKRKKSLRPGDRISFPEPLRFANFHSKAFVAEKYFHRGKPSIAFRAENGSLCRITTKQLTKATITPREEL